MKLNKPDLMNSKNSDEGLLIHLMDIEPISPINKLISSNLITKISSVIHEHYVDEVMFTSWLHLKGGCVNLHKESG